MSVQTTALTRQQNDALGSFVSAWADLKDSTLNAARAYKNCVDLGMDMTRYVSNRGLHEKLLIVAGGKLMPMSQSELLFLPAPAVATLSSLSHAEQERVMKEGIAVRRNGEVELVAFANLSASELKAAIDTTGGNGRIVSPGEQAERAAPAISKHDKLVSLRLTPAQWLAIEKQAKKAGKSPYGLIWGALKNEGLVA